MAADNPPGEFVLTLNCPDRRGIVHAVVGKVLEGGGNILDSQQFLDRAAGSFFMRVHFAAEEGGDAGEWRDTLGPLAVTFAMAWELHDLSRRPRIAILVSRLGHCLSDLLYRWRAGGLRGEVVLVASNHDDFAPLAASYGVPFRRLVSTGDPSARDAELLAALGDDIDLVVLARYMQVLGPAACTALAGRVINIHHSFLPSFAGARPYHQAYERGVKLIGATAHYVTAQLDDGPIIEQEVARVDHALGPAELAALGQDVECVVLARAVRWHLERRVMIHGPRTVVFR